MKIEAILEIISIPLKLSSLLGCMSVDLKHIVYVEIAGKNVATYLCIILLSSGYFLYVNNMSFFNTEEAQVYPAGQLIGTVSFYLLL